MYTSEQFLDKINAHLSSLDYSHHPTGLYAPIEYALSLGGKRLRPMLMLMAYNLYRDDVDTILNQAAGLEIYHNFTLLHDDLMDKADLRRGKPVVHKVWNENAAILSGDTMMMLAYKYVAEGLKPKHRSVFDLFGRTAIEVCEGQQLDMEFEQREDVTVDEYIDMIRLKTSVLLACGLKMGALLADASAPDADALYKYGVNLGLAFQLKDDLLDVYGDTSVFGKKIGGDILCNKKTYMLIRAAELASPEQKAQLVEWIEAVNPDPEKKIEAVVSIYNKVGIREECERQIDSFSHLAEESLAAVSVPEESKAALRAMLDKLKKRNS
jgi:geranylgeranyl diphosphate synthase, type II